MNLDFVDLIVAVLAEGLIQNSLSGKPLKMKSKTDAATVCSVHFFPFFQAVNRIPSRKNREMITSFLQFKQATGRE